MINYCEESDDTSSTDEEDLCAPRANLRRRGTNINYNENALAKGQEEDDEESKENVQKPKLV